MNGTAGVGGFTDLADGPIYGSYVASTATNGQFTITLTNKALKDINRSMPGRGGFGNDFVPNLFAIGGSISTLSNLSENQYFLGLPVPYADLFLFVKRYDTQCPPPVTSEVQ